MSISGKATGGSKRMRGFVGDRRRPALNGRSLQLPPTPMGPKKMQEVSEQAARNVLGKRSARKYAPIPQLNISPQLLRLINLTYPRTLAIARPVQMKAARRLAISATNRTALP